MSPAAPNAARSPAGAPPFAARWRKIADLRERGDEASLRALLDALGDGEVFVHLAAAQTLRCWAGRPEVLSAIVRRLAADDVRERLAAAAHMLSPGGSAGGSWTPESTSLVARALGDEEAPVRLAAVQALATMGILAYPQLELLGALARRDREPQVRAASKRAIRHIRDVIKRAPAELEAAGPVAGRGSELEAGSPPEGRGTELVAGDEPAAEDTSPKRRRWPFRR